MRGVRAAIFCLLAVPALSGGMRNSTPVAAVQSRDLAAMAYGQAYGMVPAPTRAAYAAAAAGLASETSAKLRNGYIREPSVAVEIEAYRPFFILGEAAAPGQYPYVPNMSVESAVAIAGGFSPRARRERVTLTHTESSGSSRMVVPLGTTVDPGDTVLVGERWF